MTDEIAPKLRLVQIFLKSATFSHRGDPIALPQNTPHPAQNCSVTVTILDLEPKRDESASAPPTDSAPVLVTVGIVTSPDFVGALYDFNVEMAAIIERDDDAARALPKDRVMEIGATLLYPYVRETVSNLTIRGRFGPVWLNPFNIRAAVKNIEEVKQEERASTGTNG